MKLHTLGMNYHHSSDFLIDRPNGSGDDLLVIFKTAAIIKLNNNIEHISSDSAVIYPAGLCQYYGADGCEYMNHWVHFELSDRAFAERIGLPFNTVIPINDVSAAEHYLELLSVESVSESRNSEEICGLLLRLLLSKLAESADMQIGAASQHSSALRELRASIRRNPAGSRSIDAIARELSLSPSHFQYLYKKEFGISCYEDILSARLDMAKYYLRSTSLTIRQIAELCGYENDVHFIRQFKKRMGITAGEYRKQN